MQTDAIVGLIQNILTLCKQVTRVVGLTVKCATKKNLTPKRTKKEGK